MASGGGFLISQIKHLQGRVFERMLASSGIDAFNGAQGRILYVLWQQDDVPIVTLSNRTGLAKNTLTGMLDRMEASGVIARKPDIGDRRVTRITLTPAARALRQQYEAVSARMTELFYRGFSQAEINAFETSLARILNNLTEEERS